MNEFDPDPGRGPRTAVVADRCSRLPPVCLLAAPCRDLMLHTTSNAQSDSALECTLSLSHGIHIYRLRHCASRRPMPHLTSLTSQRASRHQSARHRAAYLQLAAARRAPRSSPLPPTQPSLQGTSCHPTRPPARTPQSSRTRSALPPFPLSPAHGRLADTAPCARHTTSTIYTLVVVL